MKSCVGRLWSAELSTGIDRTLVTPSESPGLSWVPSTPTPRSAFSNLGSNLDRQGRHAEAEPVHRRAMEIGEKVLGPEHSDTATGVANLGSNLAHHCPQNRDTSPVINKPNTGRIEATLDGFLRSRPNNLGLRPETRPWLSACPLNTAIVYCLQSLANHVSPHIAQRKRAGSNRASRLDSPAPVKSSVHATLRRLFSYYFNLLRTAHSHIPGEFTPTSFRPYFSTPASRFIAYRPFESRFNSFDSIAYIVFCAPFYWVYQARISRYPGPRPSL